VTVTDSDGETASATSIVSVGSGSLQTIVLDGDLLRAGEYAGRLLGQQPPTSPRQAASHTPGTSATARRPSPASLPPATATRRTGTYTATVTVTDTFGDQAGSSAPVAISNNASDPLFKPVVNQSSFTYLGSFALPQSANGYSTAFSYGGLTYRYVNGKLQFFTTSHVNSGGLVYEFNGPGLRHRPLQPPAGPGGEQLGGCLHGAEIRPELRRIYDPVRRRPDVRALLRPELEPTVLELRRLVQRSLPKHDQPGLLDAERLYPASATGMGAWSLADRPEKFDRGGVTAIPQWFADRFTGGATLGVGFGGLLLHHQHRQLRPRPRRDRPPGPLGQRGSVRPGQRPLNRLPGRGTRSRPPRDQLHQLL